MVLKTVKDFNIKFKLHHANDRFPDALTPSYMTRSDWQAHFWNSREPAYQKIFTRCMHPETGNKIAFFENPNIFAILDWWVLPTHLNPTHRTCHYVFVAQSWVFKGSGKWVAPADEVEGESEHYCNQRLAGIGYTLDPRLTERPLLSSSHSLELSWDRDGDLQVSLTIPTAKLY